MKPPLITSGWICCVPVACIVCLQRFSVKLLVHDTPGKPMAVRVDDSTYFPAYSKLYWLNTLHPGHLHPCSYRYAEQPVLQKV